MTAPPPADPLAVSAAALARGHAREFSGNPAGALAAYDSAYAALAGAAPAAPVAPDHRRALGLAALNRGNALQKLAVLEASAARRAAALDAYAAALGCFEALPAAADPSLSVHLGACFLNRGHALLAAGQNAAAIADFEAAAARFSALPADAGPARRLNLAGARANLALALLPADPARAAAAAAAALGLVAATEAAAPADAEAGLRARRALVLALVSPAYPDSGSERLARATDAVETGLALSARWENLGAVFLRPLAVRLFDLGAQLYRAHQPHFLAEFIAECLLVPGRADDAEFRAAAARETDRALAALRRPQLILAGDAASDRLLASVHALRAVRDRFASPAAGSFFHP